MTADDLAKELYEKTKAAPLSPEELEVGVASFFISYIMTGPHYADHEKMLAHFESIVIAMRRVLADTSRDAQWIGPGAEAKRKGTLQ